MARANELGCIGGYGRDEHSRNLTFWQDLALPKIRGRSRRIEGIVHIHGANVSFLGVKTVNS